MSRYGYPGWMVSHLPKKKKKFHSFNGSFVPCLRTVLCTPQPLNLMTRKSPSLNIESLGGLSLKTELSFRERGCSRWLGRVCKSTRRVASPETPHFVKYYVSPWLADWTTPASEAPPGQRINALEALESGRRGTCIQRPQEHETGYELKGHFVQGKILVRSADSLPSGCFQCLKDQARPREIWNVSYGSLLRPSAQPFGPIINMALASCWIPPCPGSRVGVASLKSPPGTSRGCLKKAYMIKQNGIATVRSVFQAT